MTALCCSSRGITKQGVRGWGKSCLGRGPLKLVNSNPSMLVCNIYTFNLWFKSGELEWCQTPGMIPDCVFFLYMHCTIHCSNLALFLHISLFSLHYFTCNVFPSFCPARQLLWDPKASGGAQPGAARPGGPGAVWRGVRWRGSQEAHHVGQ